MKINRMMRLASILLVLVLMTSSVVGGTFAKYTTSVDGYDTARVAKWGFEPSEIELDGLFNYVYEMDADPAWATNSVVASDGKTDLIAPGTTGSAKFGFNYDEVSGGAIGAPEVAYTFEVNVDETGIADSIKANKNIQWKLDEGNWVTWNEFVAAVEALDGSTAGAGQYAPNTLPDAFNSDGEMHTISWQWIFFADDAQDKDVDTVMGNADDLAQVTVKITVTATQVD